MRLFSILTVICFGLAGVIAHAGPVGASLIDTGKPEGRQFTGSKHNAALEENDGTLRITVPQGTKNVWDVNLKFPAVAPLPKHALGVCDLAARAVDGKGEVSVLVQRSQRPFGSILKEDLRLDTKWKRFLFPFVSDDAYSAGETRLNFQFGKRKQTVEIKDIRVRVFPKGTSRLAMAQAMGVPLSRLGASRGSTDYPLSPESLMEMGAMEALPVPTDAAPADGAWNRTWRIWTNYGYRHKANQNCGYLRIERIPSDAPGRFTLRVDEWVKQSENGSKHATAEIVCRADAVASLIEWKGEAKVDSPTDAPLAETPVPLKGKASGNPPVASHWGLFEAVQRLPFKKGAPVRFDMLEELDLRKPGQQIVYRGVRKVGDATLHRFDQIGAGILPFEYYLDDNHRLLLAITFCRAYILDPQAAAKGDAR